jgi:hypothetical protein
MVHCILVAQTLRRCHSASFLLYGGLSTVSFTLILAGAVIQQRHHSTNPLSYQLSLSSRIWHVNLSILCRRAGKVDPVLSFPMQSMLTMPTDHGMGQCMYVHWTRLAKVRQYIQQLLLRKCGFRTWGPPRIQGGVVGFFQLRKLVDCLRFCRDHGGIVTLDRYLRPQDTEQNFSLSRYNLRN